MKLSDVLFVGGDVNRLASIKIRCRDVVERLGGCFHYSAASVDELPSGYKLYWCVKPDFGIAGIEKIKKRGTAVVWDILDDSPPQSGIERYVTSTHAAKAAFEHLGPVTVIPHHHCNMDGYENVQSPEKIAYIGNEHWYPELQGIAHERYFIHGWTREQVVAAYRNVGIAINLRKSSLLAAQHVQMNSGIKLINCLGFGIPSVSAEEPAYREIAPECTIFTDVDGCADVLEALKRNQDFYIEMKSRCLQRSNEFHIDQIVNKYRMLIKSL